MGNMVVVRRDPKPFLARAPWFLLGLMLVLLAIATYFNLHSAGATNNSGWGTSGVAVSAVFGLAMFAFPVVGVLVVRAEARNPIGWILLAIGLVWSLDGFLTSYAGYASVHPGSLRALGLAVALDSWLWVPGFGLIGTFLLLLFPDGHLPSHGWRWLARISAGTMIMVSVAMLFSPGSEADSGYPHLMNPLGIPALGTVLDFVQILIIVIPLCMIGCAAGLVRRFRRSQGRERLQLKWLTAGGSLLSVFYLFTSVVSLRTSVATNATPGWVHVVQDLSLFSLVLIPIAIGIAMLRHQLYDIDRIINRTLVYGLLTFALTGVYFGLVALIRRVTDPVAGHSRVAVALSTLAVAALFRPARLRTQAFIDRRFYRRKYDAALTLEDFTKRLSSEVDLERLKSELVGVTSEVMQPDGISLWIREPV